MLLVNELVSLSILNHIASSLVQAINVSANLFLVSFVANEVGLFLPAIFVIGLGALIGYLIFQFIDLASNKEDLQPVTEEYHYTDELIYQEDSKLMPYISFQKFTFNEVYTITNDENEESPRKSI